MNILRWWINWVDSLKQSVRISQHPWTSPALCSNKRVGLGVQTPAGGNRRPLPPSQTTGTQCILHGNWFSCGILNGLDNWIGYRLKPRIQSAAKACYFSVKTRLIKSTQILRLCVERVYFNYVVVIHSCIKTNNYFSQLQKAHIAPRRLFFIIDAVGEKWKWVIDHTKRTINLSPLLKSNTKFPSISMTVAMYFVGTKTYSNG